MSNNDSEHWELFAQLTPKQKHEFATLRLAKQRVANLGYTFTGVHTSPEHEAYDEMMSRMQSQETGASTSHTVPDENQSQGPEASTWQTDPSEYQSHDYCDNNKGDIQYKSANIYDPTKGRYEEVTVIEDSACRVNFISPKVAEQFNLVIQEAPPITYHTWAGAFTSTRGAPVTWLGKKGKPGTDWFYIAPENGPSDVQVVVGTQFTNDHPGAFKNREQLAMLTVAAKMNKDESSEIANREARANTQAAELQRKKKQASQKRGEPKSKSTSSKSSHAKK